MKFKLVEAAESKICCICKKPFDGYGNNAEPVCSGTCCDECNMKEVIPARMKMLDKSSSEDIDEAVLNETDESGNDEMDANCEDCGAVITIPVDHNGPAYCADCMKNHLHEASERFVLIGFNHFDPENLIVIHGSKVDLESIDADKIDYSEIIPATDRLLWIENNDEYLQVSDTNFNSIDEFRNAVVAEMQKNIDAGNDEFEILGLTSFYIDEDSEGLSAQELTDKFMDWIDESYVDGDSNSAIQLVKGNELGNHFVSYTSVEEFLEEFEDDMDDEEFDESLNENSVSSKIPEAIDQFLQDIAQMYQTISYKDIMDHDYTAEDLQKLAKLRGKFRREITYADGGDEDAADVCETIANKVADILKRVDESNNNCNEKDDNKMNEDMSIRAKLKALYPELNFGDDVDEAFPIAALAASAIGSFVGKKLAEDLGSETKVVLNDALDILAKDDKNTWTKSVKHVLDNIPDAELTDVIDAIKDKVGDTHISASDAAKLSQAANVTDPEINKASTLGKFFDLIDINNWAKTNPKATKSFITIALAVVSVLEPTPVGEIITLIVAALPDSAVAKIIEIMSKFNLPTIVNNLFKKFFAEKNKSDDDLAEGLGLGAGIALGGAALGAGMLGSKLLDDIDEEGIDKEELNAASIEDDYDDDMNFDIDESHENRLMDSLYEGSDDFDEYDDEDFDADPTAEEEAIEFKDALKVLVNKFGNHAHTYELRGEQYERYDVGATYTRKFKAPNDYIAMFAMQLHKAPTIANFEHDYHFNGAYELLRYLNRFPTVEALKDYVENGAWMDDGDDYIFSLKNLTTGETLYESAAGYDEYEDDDYDDWDDAVDEDLDEDFNKVPESDEEHGKYIWKISFDTTSGEYEATNDVDDMYAHGATLKDCIEDLRSLVNEQAEFDGSVVVKKFSDKHVDYSESDLDNLGYVIVKYGRFRFW